MDEQVLLTLEYDKILVTLGHQCASDLGKRMVTRLRPIDDKEILEEWQEETENAIDLILEWGDPPLFGIQEIKSSAHRASKGGVLNPKQLLEISESLRVSRFLITYIEEAEGSRLTNFIASLFTQRGLENLISNAILSENEIADSASSELLRIRRAIQSKESQIKSKLNKVLGQASEAGYLSENLSTVRGGRYVLPVRSGDKNKVPGVVHDQSGSGQTVYIEPLELVNLNNEITQLQVDEEEEIQRILRSLSEEVSYFHEEIAFNQDKLQYVDFSFAKAKYALAIRGIRPIFTDNRVVDIHQARHPLLDQEEVVPIDISLGEDFNTLIITGPNTGGKTVTLKTLGLLTLMAQSGLQVPAKSPSKFGVFSSVYADIGDKQSIEMSLSSFSASMTNVIDILEKANYKSLFLFDELGSGTDPTEGAALAMAILSYVNDQHIRTLATTHYSELKVFAMREEGVQNASVEFDIETLSPSYKLSIGLPGKSNAFEISDRLGLPDHILKRAESYLDSGSIHFEDALQEIEDRRKQAEKDQAEMEESRVSYEEKLRTMQKELKKAEDRYKRELEESKAEARDIIDEAQATAQKIIRQAKEANKAANSDLDRTLSSINEQVKSEKEDLKPAPILKHQEVSKDDIKLGETVEVVSMNQEGVVIAGPDDHGDVQIQMGILKINSNVKDLRKVKNKADSESSPAGQSHNKIISNRKKMNISPELDIRGQRFEEAMDIVDNYLDDAVLAGLAEIRIIHGKGTGALRKGVTELLRKDKRIDKFALADVREGGAGVTVCQLK